MYNFAELELDFLNREELKNELHIGNFGGRLIKSQKFRPTSGTIFGIKTNRSKKTRFIRCIGQQFSGRSIFR